MQGAEFFARSLARAASLSLSHTPGLMYHLLADPISLPAYGRQDAGSEGGTAGDGTGLHLSLSLSLSQWQQTIHSKPQTPNPQPSTQDPNRASDPRQTHTAAAHREFAGVRPRLTLPPPALPLSYRGPAWCDCQRGWCDCRGCGWTRHIIVLCSSSIVWCSCAPPSCWLCPPEGAVYGSVAELRGASFRGASFARTGGGCRLVLWNLDSI